MTLDRDTAQHQIDLIVIIPIPLQVFNDPQTTLPVRHRGVHIVLLAVLVNTESLKVYHPAWTELWLYRTWHEDGRFAVDHAEFLLAVFDHIKLDGDDAGDLDGAAEGDLAVALCTPVT